MTQHEAIINYLKQNGSITPMEAFDQLGITKLSTRIGELKKQGYQFNTEYISGVNRYGNPTYFCRYTLLDMQK